MHGDERTGRGDARCVQGPGGLGPVLFRHGDVRAQVDRLGPDQRDDLQPPHQIVLERRPRHRPVQRRGARRTAPGRDPRPEPQQERVRVAAASVQLHPQVEVARPQGRAERLDDLGRVVRRPVRAGLPPHARDPRSGQHLVHRRRPAVEQRRDRRRRHQRDRRVRVGGPQGGERGLRHDVVAEAVGAQHHDPVHRGHRAGGRREEVGHLAPIPRPRLPYAGRHRDHRRDHRRVSRTVTAGPAAGPVS